MSEFDISERSDVIIRGLQKLGLEIRHGSRHDIATIPNSGRKTNVPRHKKLKRFTVGSICDFLLANGYSKADIKKAFRWK